MSISYSLNKIFYLLFSDYRIQIIEDTLNCTIVGDHGRYYGRYISYLVSANINEDKLDELEHILKRHCEIVRKDFNSKYVELIQDIEKGLFRTKYPVFIISISDFKINNETIRKSVIQIDTELSNFNKILWKFVK